MGTLHSMPLLSPHRLFIQHAFCLFLAVAIYVDFAEAIEGYQKPYVSPELFNRHVLTHKVSIERQIDICKADLNLLMTLPYINQNIALHLIRARQEGRLSTFEDLKSVLKECLACTIAEYVAEQLKERIVFETVTGRIVKIPPKPVHKIDKRSEFWGD